MATSPKPPKGAKKGGARFPRITLEAAVAYAKKLVSKTQISALPRETVFPGVFNASGTQGEIRASALRQYGLLDGPNSEIQASQLAKDIASAPDDELAKLYQVSALKPAIFKSLYDVFQGDTVSLAKIKQQSVALEVHIDSADDCAAHFAATLVFAGLAKESGSDSVTIAGVNELMIPASGDDPADADEGGLGEEGKDAKPDAVKQEPPSAPLPAGSSSHQPPPPDGAAASGGRAVIHVNVTLDSSLDTEKLEKQLQLLRRFGAL